MPYVIYAPLLPLILLSYMKTYFVDIFFFASHCHYARDAICCCRYAITPFFAAIFIFFAERWLLLAITIFFIVYITLRHFADYAVSPADGYAVISSIFFFSTIFADTDYFAFFFAAASLFFTGFVASLFPYALLTDIFLPLFFVISPFCLLFHNTMLAFIYATSAPLCRFSPLLRTPLHFSPIYYAILPILSLHATLRFSPCHFISPLLICCLFHAYDAIAAIFCCFFHTMMLPPPLFATYAISPGLSLSPFFDFIICHVFMLFADAIFTRRHFSFISLSFGYAAFFAAAMLPLLPLLFIAFRFFFADIFRAIAFASISFRRWLLISSLLIFSFFAADVFRCCR